MTVQLRGQVIELSGHCASDDAEQLLGHLLSEPIAMIDWRACERAHTAVVQVLLAAQRPVWGPPESAFLARWVQPVLRKD
jgi:hypothetical protein